MSKGDYSQVQYPKAVIERGRNDREQFVFLKEGHFDFTQCPKAVIEPAEIGSVSPSGH